VLCCDTLRSISSNIVLDGLPYVAVFHQLLPAVPIMLHVATGQQLHIYPAVVYEFKSSGGLLPWLLLGCLSPCLAAAAG